MSFQIQKIIGREVYDSRGNQTVEAEIWLNAGSNGGSGDSQSCSQGYKAYSKGRAITPSGASTGSREALELRDGDPKRLQGSGVRNAVAHLEHAIAAAIVGKTFSDQQAFDETLISLDGTENKSHLGANAILAASMAFAHARADALQKPLYQTLSANTSFSLPVPMMNVINGGAHADNNVDIQEFMLMPIGAPSFHEAFRQGVEVFLSLKSLLRQKKLNTAVGDEGGFAPDLSSNQAALDLLMKAIQEAGFVAGKDFMLALDIASSEFYRDNLYHLHSEGLTLSSEQFVAYLTQLVRNYPILSIEDGMAEQDWEGWRLLSSGLRQKVQLVGDDLFVTNCEILERGIFQKIANAILIKPNQIGTMTETLQAIALAKSAGYRTIISHRSGESEDTTIADLAVAVSSGQIKTGSCSRTDRMAKYNQLLRIERELGEKALYNANPIMNFNFK